MQGKVKKERAWRESGKAGRGSGKVRLEGRRPRRLYSSTPKGNAVLCGVKRAHIKGVWREFVSYLLSPE